MGPPHARSILLVNELKLNQISAAPNYVELLPLPCRTMPALKGGCGYLPQLSDHEMAVS